MRKDPQNGKTAVKSRGKRVSVERDINDEAIQAVIECAKSGNLRYSLSVSNTGDCFITPEPIWFHHEFAPPKLDPKDKKYIIIRGNESPRTLRRLEKKYGGNVEFLPSCTEIRSSGQHYVELWCNGMAIAHADSRNVIMSF